MVTDKIRTLQVDKGFGFIKDETGKEYFFHRSAVYGEGLRICAKGIVWSLTSARGPRDLEPRTSDAPLHNDVERQLPDGDVVRDGAAVPTLG